MDVEENLNQSVTGNQLLAIAFSNKNVSERAIQTEIPSDEQSESNHESLLFFSTSLFAIATVGTLAILAIVGKRLRWRKTLDSPKIALKTNHSQFSCEKCRFFNNNPYIKCALHPSTVLTAQAKDCTDYSPPSEK
ncbi:MAG: hypothetical protein HC847_19610 [Hydrococcus sp. RU_2_2]|jgi:hypothetical protein|nr:hypothetical protein [Hydrococcus sp. RU_2_2]NJP21013.1 hypothetical protein [Hydrococcus sp. CRU_1_1]